MSGLGIKENRHFCSECFWEIVYSELTSGWEKNRQVLKLEGWNYFLWDGIGCPRMGIGRKTDNFKWKVLEKLV